MNARFRMIILLFALQVVGCGRKVENANEAAPARDLPDQYFPPPAGVWEEVNPEDVDWSSEGLEAVFDFARRNNSTGMVLLHRGRILGERYWVSLPEAAGADDALEYLARVNKYFDTENRPVDDVASVQKSVVAFLVGMARERGLLDIDQPVSSVLGEGWSNTEPESEALITIRHLMSMSSGLDERRNFQASAGQAWRYSTGAYSQVIRVLETVTGTDLQSLSKDWLFERLGMDQSRWVWRPWSRPYAPNHLGLATSARDAARFGLLILAEGTWNGERILDPALVSEMLTPSQDINPSYGLLWWLNGQEAHRVGDGTELLEGPLLASAPDDLVAARGACARRIYVVPSLDLVVTRVGAPPPGTDSGRCLGFSRELWTLLSAAAPGR